MNNDRQQRRALRRLRRADRHARRALRSLTEAGVELPVSPLALPPSQGQRGALQRRLRGWLVRRHVQRLARRLEASPAFVAGIALGVVLGAVLIGSILVELHRGDGTE